jgi:hypothetical protein
MGQIINKSRQKWVRFTLERLLVMFEESEGCTYWLKSSETVAKMQVMLVSTVSGDLSSALCRAGIMTSLRSAWVKWRRKGPQALTNSDRATCLHVMALLMNRSNTADWKRVILLSCYFAF